MELVSNYAIGNLCYASLKQFPRVTYFSALHKVIKTLKYEQETCKVVNNFVVYLEKTAKCEWLHIRYGVTKFYIADTF